MTVTVGRARTPSVTKRPIIPRSKWDLLPGGHRVRSAQLNQFNSVTGQTAWAGAVPEAGGPIGHPWDLAIANWWTQWPWENQIRPQLQAMASYGFNATRWFVSTTCRNPASGYAPQLDTQTFLNRMRQLITYAQTLGIRAYPCLAVDSEMFGTGVMGGYLPTLAWVLNEYRTICRFLARHADAVFGIDLLNEGNSDWRSGNCAPVYQAVKAVAPGLKYTWSGGNQAAPGNGGVTPFDHYDIHIYTDGVAANYAEQFMTLWNCPLMIGETGQVNTVDRTARYTQAANIVNDVGPGGMHVAGVNFWDWFGSWGGGNWGVVNDDFTVRSDVQSIILGLPN